MDWIRAADLNEWAISFEAKPTLPKLIRRLIHESSSNIVQIEMPADEEAQRHGFDGIVENTSNHPFIPTGQSVWEMGAGEACETKANKDFATRSVGPGKIDRANTTFVFVTPRDWTDKQTWIDEKKKQGIWKDVRAYDSNNLAEWLELCCGVATWLATLSGKKPPGASDPESHLLNLLSISTPQLKPAVFLTSRVNEVRKITEWATSQSACALAIECDAFDGIDFFVAAASESGEKADKILSRSVIVEKHDAWRSLAISKRSLILVQHPTLSLGAEGVAEAVRNGHHVLLCSRFFATGNVQTINLPRAFRDQLQLALRDSGFDEISAGRFARESGGSLTVLKRRLTTVGSTHLPRWCEGMAAREIAPLLLVGAWEENSPADQAVVKAINGRAYGDVASLAQVWALDLDPLFLKVSGCWRLLSREDSWHLAGRSITAKQLEGFEKAAVEVLSEDDPRFDLPPENRWAAAIHGKKLACSACLRDALVETIALLGSRPGVFSGTDSQKAVAVAERVVRKLLPDGASWKRWATLSEFLPKLAEGAPEVLLDAIETDLSLPEPQIPRLLADESNSPFSACLHAGVLWALENLAWAPNWVTRVCLVLAKLAELDPGGRWANRPSITLREMFMPWHPQIALSVQDRLRLLDVLQKKHADIAWTTMLEMLPGGHGVAHSTHKPYWRDWAADSPTRVTDAEYKVQVEGIAMRLVEHCEATACRLTGLVSQMNRLPSQALDNFLERLAKFDIACLSREERSAVWSKLREVLARQRRHLNWKMAEARLTRLEKICSRFEPVESVVKLKPIFARWPDLSEIEGEPDLGSSEHDKRLRELRLAAIKQIFSEKGLDGLVELADAVENSFAVGYLLAEIGLVKDETQILPSFLTASSQNRALFAFGFASRTFQLKGWAWVNDLTHAGWSHEQLGHLCRILPVERTTWDFVDRLDENGKAAYWSRVEPRGENLSTADVGRAVREFMLRDRPWDAIFLLNLELHSKKGVESGIIFDALEFVLKSSSPGAKMGWNRNHARWEVGELIGYLQNDPSADFDRLVSLEWQMIPLLDEHTGSSPKTLHRWIRANPEAFVELIRIMFYPKNLPKADRDPQNSEDQAKAEHAYRLVESLRELPGARDDGTIDQQYLLNWILRAREACVAINRLERCDNQIGVWLANAPNDSDGTFPCKAVRDIIETVNSKELLTGFHCGIVNKRGLTWRSHKDGGEQERELAATFGSHAAAIQLESPKTASVLRAVERGYQAEATREDERTDDW